MTDKKIKIKLTGSEWISMTNLVLNQGANIKLVLHEDAYTRALLVPLLKQVYVKLHNKMHSVDSRKNTLNLTEPEGAAFVKAFVEYSFLSNPYSQALVNSVIQSIDKAIV